MKLVLKLKLLTDPETDALLRETSLEYLHVCNFLSRSAFENRTFRQFDLHRLAYHTAMATFDIPSQLVIRALANVCSSYKTLLAQIRNHNTDVERFNACCQPEDRQEFRVLTLIAFQPNTAVTFDQRVMLLDTEQHRVSLRTLSKRVWIAFQAGERRKHLLQYAKGQADLKRSGKDWYLFQTLEVPEAELQTTTNHLGVDIGICTVASATDGVKTVRFSGSKIRAVRNHHYQLRRGLQRHNTKSSRKRVRTLMNKESRRVRGYNHLVSRRIVEQAKRTNSTIVLEDLEGIREGVKVGDKSQRRERFSWAYAQLIGFIVYKAQQEGIPVIFVPPHYTSKTCSECHYMADANRTTQAWFQCRKCGFCWHADDNAAINIRFLGAESVRQKRPVCMQEYLHTDRRKPLSFSQG